MSSAESQPAVLPTLLPGFIGTTLPDWLAARLRAGLGGVCLFGPNIESRDQLRALTAAIQAANPQAIIALDEEGGDVTRLFAHIGAPSPGNAVLGRIDDPEMTRRDAVQSGWELREAGCNVNFAPTVDVNSRSDNPVIGVRSFGATAELVARHGTAWVTGLQSTGIAASAKHFPGHGDTAQDSHLSLPVVGRSLKELRERELVPFAAAIDAGARAVMTSHILLPQIDADNPATMSRTILVDLLRNELGFSGLIVSDALDMAGAQRGGGLGEAAVRALRGGCDLLCLGTETTDAELTEIERAVSEAVGSGGPSSDRIGEAADRVLGLAADLDGLRTAIPVPADFVPGRSAVSGDLELIRSFDVSAAASDWRSRASYAVVRLEAVPNMATGPTPWGPFAAVAADPSPRASLAFAAHPQFTVAPDRSTLPAPVTDEPVLVVGRDVHRHAFARAAVDRLRHEHAEVLVVDMGWPSDDRRYADLATFGSSRLMGQALLRYLDGQAGARS